MYLETFNAIKTLVDTIESQDKPTAAAVIAAIEHLKENVLCYDTVCVRCKREQAEWRGANSNTFDYCTSCWCS